MSSNSSQIQEVVGMEEEIVVFSADGRVVPMMAQKDWNGPRCAVTAQSIRELGYESSSRPVFLPWARHAKSGVIDDVEFDIVENAKYPIMLSEEFCRTRLDELSTRHSSILHAHAYGAYSGNKHLVIIDNGSPES